MAPLAVVLIHAVLAVSLGQRAHFDPIAHLLGGAAMALFLNQVLLTWPHWFGRPTPGARTVIAFCMTATVALLWEFMEFLFGGTLMMYTQMNLPETMSDLLLGCAGAGIYLAVSTALTWMKRGR